MNDSAFSVDDEKDSAGLLLWQTTVLWQRAIKQSLDPHQIAHSQFVILAILLWLEEHDIDATQAMIVQQSKMDKMTVSKSLKILATRDLVKRSENTEDTRVKSVWLTKKGKTLAVKLVPIVEGTDAEFFKTLGQEDLKELLRLLGKLV